MKKDFSEKDILNLAVSIRRRLTKQTGSFAETNTDFVDNAIIQEIKNYLK